jgi:hypothetical protein
MPNRFRRDVANRRARKQSSKVNAKRAIELLVVSQIHPIPGPIRWIAFFAAIICAAIAANPWHHT